MELATFALLFALSLAISLALTWVTLEAVMTLMTRSVAPTHAAIQLHVARAPRVRAA